MASTLSSLGQLLPLLSLFSTTVTALPGHHVKRAPPVFNTLGCHFDNEGGKRAIEASSYAADDMTVESCVEFCAERNHALAGVEYGRECFCGDILSAGNGPAPAGDCSFPCAGNPLQKCGAGNRLNLYIIETAPVKGPANLPGITSLGCYVDTPARVFPYNVIGTDDMTAAKCAENCAGYPYFGTQYSRECFCGTTAPIEPSSASECSMTCTGDESEYCGGGMRLNVYRVDSLTSTATTTVSGSATSTPASTPTASPVVDGYEYQGCWTDNVPNRVLPGNTFADGAMTLAKCADFCKTSSYGWFGVTYSSECFCGATLDTNSVQVGESDCNMACSGDPTEKCGAGNRVNVYADPALAVPVASNLPTVGQFSYKGCWTDDTGNRTLTAVDFRADDMTVEKCAERCASYHYFGVEFARECYCGDELGGESAPESQCSSLCVGNGEQWCGAPYRLNVYIKFPTTTASTTSEPTATSESSSTTTEEPTTTSEEPTTTTEEPSSTTSEESTTTTEEPSTTSSEESTTTTEDPTTTSEPSTTTSEESTTTTEESTTTTEEPTATTSEEPSTTTSEESTTTTEPSTTSESATTFPTSTTLSTVVSTTSTTSTTTTQGPTLTTITSCPPTPTAAAVPEMCYHPKLPFNCDRLTSAWPRQSLSTYLRQCQTYLTSFGVPANTAASSCFPRTTTTPPNTIQAASTASSVWNCLQTAGVVCSLESSCTTATYPVSEIPQPTPTTGVNLVPNSGFESGTGYDSWTAAGFGASLTQSISTAQKRTGASSWRVDYLNTAGTTGRLTRTVKNLEPGRTYQFKLWYLHTTSSAQVRLWMAADPLGLDSDLASSNLNGKPANVWAERTLTFTPVSSFQQLEISVEGVRSGTSGSTGGRDAVYIDDISVVRIN
ncbi:WSC domain-containing protein [Cladorrhinum sp. PSN332]|nr:WSC domain-containing protein [Cladorrhinum sp. PSN332]